QFLGPCDDFGGVPVFYQIGKTHLHRYADLGLTFVKIGEEAGVNLAASTLGGRGAAETRRPTGGASDGWPAAEASPEKGFSLGFFDDAYVARFPVAVIEKEGRVQAFANV